MPEELRSARRRFFDRLDCFDSAGALLSLQLDLAGAIKQAESEIANDAPNGPDLSEHILRLRALADGIAWKILHPHAIRQLGKNEAQRPSLFGQGQGFVNVVEYAEQLFEETGLPILICDITNVLCIGDLLLVSNDEEPVIIECKSQVPKPEHLLQGRVGRQVSRALGAARYMAGEEVKVFGEAHTRLVVETDHQRAWHWEDVEEVSASAFNDGMAQILLSPGNWLWAARPEAQDAVIASIIEVLKDEKGLFQIATLAAARVDLYSPPCVWPIDLELRHQLSEGELLLFRAFDYEELAGVNKEGMAIEIRDAEYPIIVRVDGEEFLISRKFAYDAVYGFETVDSIREGLFSFVQAVPDGAHALPEDFSVEDVDTMDEKPLVHHAADMEVLTAIVDDVAVSDDALISFPVDLVPGELGAQVRVASSSGGTLGLLRLGELRGFRRRPF